MIKKKITKKINKMFVGIMLAFGMFLSAGSGIIFNLNTYNTGSVSAASIVESIDKSSSFISNNEFSSTSSAKTPPSANSWTQINDNVNNPENLVSGVFNSYEANQKTDENYLDNYKILQSPGHATNQTNLSSSNALYKNFMINSYTEYGRLGFESTPFTLEKDSYYVFEVVLKTVTYKNSENSNNEGKNYADFDSRASIYLVDDSDKILTSFEMVDSTLNPTQITNDFVTYKMYVSTKTYSSTKANLQLYLGSKDESAIGPVFFNRVNVLQLSQNRYLRETQNVNADAKNVKVLNLNSNVVTDFMPNPSFDNDWRNSGWKLIKQGNNGTSNIEVVNGTTADQSNIFLSAGLGVKDVPNTNNSSDANKTILMMHNSQENYSGIESDEITIKQHGHYQLSVWAWSNSGESTTPTIKLVDKSDRKLSDVSINVSTSVSSSTSLTNGWTKYSFYINGDPYKDVNVAVQLWLGTSESSKAKGYVYFDDITLQSLSYSDYNSIKNSNVMDYNTSDDALISNYTFNNTENPEVSTTYPLVPSAWTANTANRYAKSGVVNISVAGFNSDDLKIDENAGPSRPNALPGDDANTSNNVLMIASSQTTNSQSYTSKAVSLSESYYVLTAYFNTTNGGAGIKLLNGKNYIYNLSDLSSNGWQKVEFAIKKGTNSPSLQVELSLSGVSGYAYFDEIQLISSSEDYFNSVTPSEYVKKIDLSNTNFENTYDNGDSVLPLNDFENVTTNNNVVSGIVNLQKGFAGLSESDPNNKFALIVSSEGDVYHYVESLTDYSLSEGNYYAISVNVKTADLRSDDEKFGARLFLSGEGIDKSFENISTNGWETFTFYVNATKATTASLQLGLGNSETKCSGIALFDDITIRSIADETAFNEEISGKEHDEHSVIVNSIKTDDETETNNNDDNDNNNANLWYVLPSLISAVALIFAIIVTMVRKIKWKKPSKKVKTSYDRKKTVEKDLDRRQKIELRKQMINELEVQLKELNEEIEAYVNMINEREQERKEKLAKEHEELLNKKNKITAEKENALRERNEKIALDKKAFTAQEEEEFNAYIKRLEVKEAKQQKAVVQKEISLKQTAERKDAKLKKYLERQEFIRKEIERIDKEIEEIAREEAQIWEEYKQAKQEAKARKAEYKKQLKQEKFDNSKKNK